MPVDNRVPSARNSIASTHNVNVKRRKPNATDCSLIALTNIPSASSQLCNAAPCNLNAEHRIQKVRRTNLNVSIGSS